MQAKVNAKLKIVRFCKESAMLGADCREYGCQSRRIGDRFSEERWVRGTLPLPFPGLRWFGNECLNAADLKPLPTLSLIYGLWSCEVVSASWGLFQCQQCSVPASRARETARWLSEVIDV